MIHLLARFVIAVSLLGALAYWAEGHEPSRDIIRLAAVGDALPHQRVISTAHRKDYSYIFESIYPYIQGQDIAFINLETPIAKKIYRSHEPFIFNAPLSFLKSLITAGFNVFNLANNHALDQKEDGLVDTLSGIKNESVFYLGAEFHPRFALKGTVVEKYGIRIGFLGFTEFTNYTSKKNSHKKPPAYVNILTNETEPQVLESVERLKKSVDFVVVSIHWGDEYATLPHQRQVAYAQKIHAAGADVILGHHPHVLQPIEVSDDIQSEVPKTYITVYSLGNFISNQSSHFVPSQSPISEGTPRASAIVLLEFERVLYHDSLKPDGFSSRLVGIVPIWTKQVGSNLKVVEIDQELSEIDAALQFERPSKKLAKKLKGERDFYLSEKKWINDQLFPRREPSSERVSPKVQKEE